MLLAAPQAAAGGRRRVAKLILRTAGAVVVAARPGRSELHRGRPVGGRAVPTGQAGSGSRGRTWRTGLDAAHVCGKSAGSAGDGVEAGGQVGECVVAVGDRARGASEVTVDVAGGPPEALADPVDGVGQVSQLAGDVTGGERHVAVVVGALVAGGQGALGGEAGAVGLGVVDRGCAFAEPTVDVLHDADHAAGGGVELGGLVGEVVTIGGDLAGQGTAEPAEVVGAGVEVVLDRGPVGAPGVGCGGHVTSRFGGRRPRPAGSPPGRVPGGRWADAGVASGRLPGRANPGRRGVSWR